MTFKNLKIYGFLKVLKLMRMIIIFSSTNSALCIIAEKDGKLRVNALSSQSLFHFKSSMQQFGADTTKKGARPSKILPCHIGSCHSVSQTK